MSSVLSVVDLFVGPFYLVVDTCCIVTASSLPLPPTHTDHQFMKVPPSLLASACLCDAVKHLAPHLHSKCVEELTTLARLEQVRSKTIACYFHKSSVVDSDKLEA